jgi:hypothetical protein
MEQADVIADLRKTASPVSARCITAQCTEGKDNEDTKM